MPLRTRLRRAFTRGSQDDESFSRTSKGSKSTGKRDSIHYQPGEKMPPLKYRRPVNPEHKAHLEAFSWAKAWRRKSDQSVYSPMGSRMPSRKNSYTTVGRKSIGGRSMRRASSKDVGVDSGIGGSVIDDEEVEERKANQLREGSDEEGDVTNVGLSRSATQDPHSPSNRPPSSYRRSLSASHSRPATSDRTRRSLSHKSDKPFAPEDLELALKRSHLEVPKEESDGSRDGTPGETPGEVSTGTGGSVPPPRRGSMGVF